MDWSAFWASSGIATILAFCLNRLYEGYVTGAKARAVLRGVLLEINHAEKCATAYLEHSATHSWAPGYRIVSEFLSTGIAAAAELGKLSPLEVEALHALYVITGDANRSLELLADLRIRPRSHRTDVAIAEPDFLAQETGRARAKFQEVLQRIPTARKAATDALSRLRWSEPQD